MILSKKAQELMEKIVQTLFPYAKEIKLDHEEPKFFECVSLIKSALIEAVKEENCQCEKDHIRIYDAGIKRSIAIERERCAKIAESYRIDRKHSTTGAIVDLIAKAIRVEEALSE